MPENAAEHDAGPELARLARCGDRAALARLLGMHERPARAVIVAYVARHEADDVMQEVFLSALRGISSLRDDERVGAWVCAVARSCARSHLRKQRIRRMLKLVREPEVPPSTAAWSTDEVLDAVRKLPDAYRETITLRLVAKLSGEEIALRTGLTHGSVRVNLSRGMELLRRALREEGSP